MASNSSKKITLSTSGLTFDDVIAVARHGAHVELSQSAIEAMNSSRKYIEEYAAGGIPVYGVSTGFGALANRHIDVEDRVQLQKNIFRDAIVQHALAIKHGVFLGIERGCIIFEMLHERSRLRTLIKDLRLALINPTAAIHRHIPWFEKIHKRTNASRRPLPLPERRCLMALKRQNIIHRQNHSIRSYRRAQ